MKCLTKILKPPVTLLKLLGVKPSQKSGFTPKELESRKRSLDSIHVEENLQRLQRCLKTKITGSTCLNHLLFVDDSLIMGCASQTEALELQHIMLPVFVEG